MIDKRKMTANVINDSKINDLLFRLEAIKVKNNSLKQQVQNLKQKLVLHGIVKGSNFEAIQLIYQIKLAENAKNE